jgi:hypothetical protein
MPKKRAPRFRRAPLQKIPRGLRLVYRLQGTVALAAAIPPAQFKLPAMVSLSYEKYGLGGIGSAFKVTPDTGPAFAEVLVSAQSRLAS